MTVFATGPALPEGTENIINEVLGSEPVDGIPGETGYAVGVSTVSEGGSWLFKANGAVSSKGYGGGGVSATYLWH